MLDLHAECLKQATVELGFVVIYERLRIFEVTENPFSERLLKMCDGSLAQSSNTSNTMIPYLELGNAPTKSAQRVSKGSHNSIFQAVFRCSTLNF